MIQLFKSLLGDTPREPPARKPTPKALPTPPHRADYRAVSLTPGIKCQAVARDTAGKRYLLCEAPCLPLSACATPAKCSCKFRKHADRRDADRRLLGEVETSRWFSGAERRNRGGRRSIRI
jgi:hypothetical protein